MFDVYSKLYGLLDARERRRAILIVVLLLAVALVETFSVASVMPFIAILANPEVVQTNAYLAATYSMLGFSSTEKFLLFVGVIFLVVLVGSLVVRGVGLWAQFRFSQNRNFSWSMRLMSFYLKKPYEWFLHQHTTKIGTAILGEVPQLISNSLFPAMQIIAHGFTAVLLLVLLVAVDPLLALAVGLGLGSTYAAVYLAARRKLEKIGLGTKLAQRERSFVIYEGFGGIKDIKVAGLESAALSRLAGPSNVVAQNNIASGMIGHLPALAMQALLFGGLMLVLLYLIATRGGFAEALPTAAVYAFAGYRLMPALQNIYGAITQIKISEALLNSVGQELGEATQDVTHTAPVDLVRSGLHREVELRNVRYAYPQALRPALESVSLRIPVFSTIGLVGSTGCGKTTTVDILLGLLHPQEGQLLVDGVALHGGNIGAWQRSVGYVSQQIFLTDTTLESNIAYGVPPQDIDHAAVERASRIANLHDFVINELPDGYQTKVGERGVRLSGGQRQRIGIARALYRDPDVLILDEATSALDSLTERAVMEAVSNLAHRKTIILIAHRLSTVKKCDRIYLLDKGTVAAAGSYDELVAQNERFKAMAELS